MSRRDAVVAVLVSQGRVLVIKRGPGARRPGYWTPVSGAVEPGETQPRALVREVREEVGLVVAPAAKVWECETDDGTFLLHWWTAEVTAGDLVLDPGEVSEARWVTTDEFLRLSPTFDRHREFFTQVVPSLRQAAQRSRDPAGEGEHHLLDG